ncbi:MAG TPA: hypothetical protein PLJ35_21965 [Anaerolineae bacterium]|nr:hypothetical protein [Anaerolineae bacterium]HOR01488.1 hypothetical protein [Anaerolineae bacterium]HPL30537.1 hypothetical protein [Anaerolineae bacterium]
MRVAPWAALGIAALSLAFMAWAGSPKRLLNAIARRLAPPSNALELTIFHTNDTYGYVFPCG